MVISLEKTKYSRLFFCFIHIPKCGGMTFHSILQRNLGDSYLQTNQGLREGPLLTQDIKSYIEEKGQRFGIGGHRIRLDLPFFDCPNVEIKAISFIRSPIERIRSHYFYVNALKSNFGKDTVIRNLSYQEYLNYLVEHPEEATKIGEYQLSYLFGKQKPSFSYLERLISNQHLLLFPLDQFDKACLFLEKKFPDTIKDASYTKRNFRKNDKESSTKNIENKLAKICIQDSKLYQVANEQISLLLSSIYSERELQQAEKDFKYRCLQRQYIYSPIQEFCRKVYRVSSSW